jgi:hypothetical protein
MGDATDALVLLVVVGLRVFVPLGMFRYPLPVIVASLLIDAADKSILETFTTLNLDFYQSYDKALDIYYLSLAYIATLRNWPNLTAFNISRFLWYYRLIGTTLFELTNVRALLLIFPNVFEYFFIYLETAKTRWNLSRLTRYHLFVAAAIVWVVVKLPQEYWIHVAQLDATDFILESILGMPLTASWGEAIQENLWVIPVLTLAAILAFVGLRTLERRLPKPDWQTSFDADLTTDQYVRTTTAIVSSRHWRTGLVEKVALVALISIIFASMLPNINATPLQMSLGVGLVILGNALISHWLAERGVGWRSFGVQFLALTAINFALALFYVQILPSFDGQARWRDVMFFTLLLTLLVSLYDRYRPLYDLRVANEARSGEIHNR